VPSLPPADLRQDACQDGFRRPFNSCDLIISEVVYQQWRESDGEEAVKGFAAFVPESAAWGHVSLDDQEELGIRVRVDF
jgi:hypothetical protein